MMMILIYKYMNLKGRVCYLKNHCGGAFFPLFSPLRVVDNF